MPDLPENLTLWHGTTRRRAESILANGPDGAYVEPGEQFRSDAPDFWAVESAEPAASWILGSPFDQARNKHRLYSHEGGPAIVEFEVPQSLVEALSRNPDFADVRASGAIHFRADWGLPELTRLWPTIPCRIHEVQ